MSYVANMESITVTVTVCICMQVVIRSDHFMYAYDITEGLQFQPSHVCLYSSSNLSVILKVDTSLFTKEKHTK